MSDEQKRIEEQALDSLLVEALNQIEPPDLTERIMARLDSADREQRDVAVAPIVSTSPISTNPARSVPEVGSSPNRRLVWSLAIVATVAASILFVVFRRGTNTPGDSNSIAVTEPTAPMNLETPVDASTDTAEGPRSETPPKPPRGIPLVLDTPVDQPTVESIGEKPSQPTSLDPLPAVTLVSRTVDEGLQQYWNAIGIQATGEAGAQEVSRRLEEALGIKLSPEVLSDPELLQAEFRRREYSVAVARRWLQQFTDRGLQRVEAKPRQELVAELAASFQGDRSFDDLLVGWINGDSPQASSFYRAISKSGNKSMARRLASLTMNVDLRCVRCHDSKIEGSGQREDFWGFAALLSRGVKGAESRNVQIDPADSTSKQVFYELADGRQRLAEAELPAHWLGDEATVDGRITTVKQWAEQLKGSEALARGAVNSLWLLVHGQPLQGRVVDPVSAPHNAELDSIENELVQDMLASRFDVARTLALIVSSPSTRRSVPESLMPANAFAASEEQIQAASDAVNAFAAALPRHSTLSVTKRLDQTMRAIGGKLDQNGRPFFAQIDGDSEKQPGKRGVTETESFAADFPTRDEALPVQWLTLIENQQSRVDHLAYLAGMNELPENIAEAAEAMQNDDEVSDELMLSRVWWLVRP